MRRFIEFMSRIIYIPENRVREAIKTGKVKESIQRYRDEIARIGGNLTIVSATK